MTDHARGSYPVVLAAPESQAPFDYLVTIVMHNASAQAVYGNSATPYLNSLKNTYSYATGYAAVAEPRATWDYIALIGGSTFSLTTDCYPTDCPISAANIVDRIEAAGLTWKAWAEDYPVAQGCTTVPTSGEYSAKHFPFLYFQNIINNPARCNNLLKANTAPVAAPGTETDDLFLKALGSTTTSANYMWLSPSQCDSVDHCPLSTGDKYLSQLVPSILNSYIFKNQKAVLFITFAEGALRVTSPTDYVPAIWAGPAAKTGFSSSSPYNHYSLLKTIETAWGLSPLTSKDGGASSMGEFFKVQVGFTYIPSSPAAGQTVTFTATATGGTVPYTFAWTFGDGATGTGNTLTHTYTSQGSYTVTLKATDSRGASATASNAVNVLPPPPPITGDFTLTPAFPEANLSVSFSAIQAGGTVPYTYSWNFGDSSPPGSGNPVTHTYANAATFTVTLTVTDANGLTATASHPVTVAPRLAVVSVTATPNPSEVRVSVSFSATTSGGAGTKTFSWDFGDGSPAGSGNLASHTYSASGTLAVTVMVTDGNGVTITGTVNEVVNDRLAVAPTGSLDQATVGQNITFDAGAAGGVSPVSCSWTFGDSKTATGCIATHAYSTAGSFTATVTSTDAFKVTATGKVSVTVSDVCSTNFNWNPSSPEGGQLVTFTATTTGNCVPPVSLTWNFGDGNTDSGNPATNTYASAGGTFTVTVTLTGANGVTATKSHTIVVAPRMAVDFGSSPASPEGGQTVTFTATTAGGVGTKTCSWNFGDGGTTTGCTATHAYPSGGGTFTIKVTATDGNAVAATSSQSVVIAPRLAVTFTESPALPEGGQVVTFTANPTGGVGTIGYSWRFGDGSSGTGNPALHTYADAGGTFTVQVTASDGNAVTATSSQSVVISPRLAVTFTESPALPEGGQIVTFAATPTGGIAPIACAWTFGEGGTATGCTATHTYANAGGTFTVRVTATDANALTATSSQSVVIAPRLAVGAVTGTPNPSEVGVSVSFSTTTSEGVGSPTFSWNFDDGSSAGSGNPATHIYATAGTFTAVVTATDGNGVTAISSQSVVIAPRLAVAAATGTPNPSEVGIPASFTTTTSGGIPPVSCSWNFGDGSPAATGCSGVTHTYASAATFTVLVTASDSNSVEATGSVSVVVTNACSVAFTYSPTYPEGGVQVNFTATTLNCISPVTFAWNFGDSSTGLGSATTHTYADAGGTPNVVVTATDAEAHQTTSSQTITVAARLAVSFTKSPSSPEGGQLVTFTATTAGGVGTKTCIWELGDGGTASGCTASYTYGNMGGTFTVVVNATDSDAVTATSSRNLTIAARLAMTFTFSPATPEGGQVVTFTAAPTDGVGSASCAWTFGDGGIDNTCTSTHTYADAGGTFTINATATDGNAVTATSYQSVVIAPRLVVTFSFSPTIPEGGVAVILTAAATGGVGTVTYSWSFGDGSSATGNPTKNTYADAGGTFTVQVTATDANAVTAKSSQSVVTAPHLTAADFTSSPASPEVGVVVTFTATQTGGVAPYTYAWNFGDGSTGSGTTSTHTYAIAGTFTVSLAVTDANGITASPSHNVIVAARLISAITNSPASPEGGQAVTFTAIPTGGVALYACAWTFGDGGMVAGCTATHTYANAGGTFTVSLIIADANGVSAPASKSLLVAPRLAVTFTFSPATPESGQLVTFTSAPTGGVGSVGCAWTLGDGGTAATCTATQTYADAGGTFTVQVTSTDGNAVTAVSSQEVVIAPRLAVSFTKSPATPEGGQTVTFTATTTGGVGTKTCSWTLGDGGTTTGCKTTHTYPSAGGTFTVAVNATDGNAITAGSSLGVVIVPGLSSADFTFSPSSPETDLAVTFTGSQSGGVPPYVYGWNYGEASPAGSGRTATHAYATPATFTVTLTVTDANGVTAAGSHDVVVAPSLTVDFTFSPISPEGGQTLAFMAAATDGVQTVSYSWSFGDGSPAGSGKSIAYVYADVGGTFTVMVTATDANAVTATKSHTVIIAPRLSVAGLTYSPVSVEGGQLMTFTATTTGGVGTKTCTWNFGDGSTSTKCTATHTYANSGGTFTVTVTATDANGISAIESGTATVVPRLSAADFTFTPIPPGVDISVSFIASPTGGIGPYTYSWNFGDGSATSNGNPATHIYADSGAFTVTLAAKDSYGFTAIATNSVSVGVENQPPVFSSLPASQTVTVGQKMSFPVAASDPEGGQVSIIVENLPPGASFDPIFGQFSWTPAADETGNYSITFRAADNGTPQRITSQTATVEVRPSADQLCQDCSRALGFPLDDVVVASLAFLGLISAVVAAVILETRHGGESDTVEPEEDLDDDEPVTSFLRIHGGSHGKATRASLYRTENRLLIRQCGHRV